MGRSRQVAQPYGPNTALVQYFIERLDTMPPQAIFRAVWNWRKRIAGSPWFEAEDALSHAFLAPDRARQRKRAFDKLGAVFRRVKWTAELPYEPEILIPAGAPAAHYIAATAVAALVARDQLSAGDFQILYDPFAELVPVAELEAIAGVPESIAPESIAPV